MSSKLLVLAILTPICLYLAVPLFRFRSQSEISCCWELPAARLAAGRFQQQDILFGLVNQNKGRNTSLKRQER